MPRRMPRARTAGAENLRSVLGRCFALMSEERWFAPCARLSLTLAMMLTACGKELEPSHASDGPSTEVGPEPDTTSDGGTDSEDAGVCAFYCNSGNGPSDGAPPPFGTVNTCCPASDSWVYCCWTEDEAEFYTCSNLCCPKFYDCGVDAK